MNRHARRAKNRMAASAVAIALVLVGGFGLWSLADRVPAQETTVTGETREPAERESSEGAVDADDSIVDDAGTDDSSTDDADTPALLTTRLEVVERVDDNAPAEAFEAKVDGGIYYVLSTAPGEVGVDETTVFDDAAFRPNTIYRFDPDSGWTNAEITDRWISDFTPSNGILYAISTGRTDGSADAAIGQSNDQGASWDWRSVPELTDAASFGPGDVSPTTLRIIPVNGRTFVLSQSLGWPDWEEAIELAINAGIPATRSQIMDVNPNGVSYNLSGDAVDLNVGGPCGEIMNRYYQATNDVWAAEGSEIQSEEDYAAQMERIQPLIDAAGAPFEQELLDNGCRNEIACQRVMEAYWAIGQEIYAAAAPDDGQAPDAEEWQRVDAEVRALQAEQAPALEAELEAAGCANTIRCEQISAGIRAEYVDEEIALQKQYENYDELTEDESRDLHIREQSLWSRMEGEISSALEGTDCGGPGFGYYGAEAAAIEHATGDFNPEDFVTVTWDELGVTVPDSWGPSQTYYEHSDGQLTTLTSPFEGEIVVNLQQGDAGPEAFSLRQDQYYGFSSEQNEAGSVWTTSDGVAWTRSGSSSSPFGGGHYSDGPHTLGDVSLRLRWEEPSAPPELNFPEVPPDAEIRENEDGSLYFIDEAGEPVDIPEQNFGPNNTFERSVAGAPWEAIAIDALAPGVTGHVSRIIDSAVGVAVIVQPIGPNGETHIVYSSDGVNWEVVSMDADWVSAVSAGDSTLFVGSRITDQGDDRRPPATVLLRPAR